MTGQRHGTGAEASVQPSSDASLPQLVMGPRHQRCSEPSEDRQRRKRQTSVAGHDSAWSSGRGGTVAFYGEGWSPASCSIRRRAVSLSRPVTEANR